MTTFPGWLWLALIGGLISVGLLAVSAVKTVKYHGWGKQEWAPPAVPWFVGAMVVGGLTLICAFALMN